MSYFSQPIKYAFFCCSLYVFMGEVRSMELTHGSDHGVATQQSSWSQSFDDMLRYFKDSGSIIWSCLKNPTEVAAFTASSPWVVREILSHVQAGNVLEVGAGAGSISVPLLKQCRGRRYDGVEICPELFSDLRSHVALLQMPGKRSISWPTIHLYNEDFVRWLPEGIDELQANGFYDTVVSTVPITRLPAEVMQAILIKVNRLLKPGGVFIYVSLAGARSFGHWLGFFKALFGQPESWQQYQGKLKFIDTWIQENFDQNEVLVWRNITPMRVYWAVKKGGGASADASV